MVKVYVIRHAEAEGNLYRRIHGHYDSIITETGMKQIEKLKERFRDISIDAVYSSDLIRTQTTAKAISVPRGLPVITTPKLREVNMGVWEDMTWGDVAIQWPEMLVNFNYDPENWLIPDGEPHYDVVGRMTDGILELASKHEGGAIAVVTHGSASRSLFAHLMSIPTNKILDAGMSDNTAVSLLNVSGDKIEIEYKNDNSHLPFELSIFSRQHWHNRDSKEKDINFRYEPMDLISKKELYLEYRRDGWMAVHGTMDGYTDNYYDLALKHQSDHPFGVVEVFCGDEPAGLLELDVKSGAKDSYGGIAFYYLCKKFRNKGFGVQLLGQAISVYRPMGRSRLRLHVAEENLNAISFYCKYGFENVGKVKGALGMLRIMEKDISLRIR